MSIGSYRVSSHSLSFRVQILEYLRVCTFQTYVHESVHSPREGEGFNGDPLPPLLPVLCTNVYFILILRIFKKNEGGVIFIIWGVGSFQGPFCALYGRKTLQLPPPRWYSIIYRYLAI